MVNIAALAFDDVSDEEKIRHQARIKETGEYLGYKLPQYWVCGAIRLCLAKVLTFGQHIANGVKDRIEHYNCETTPFESTFTKTHRNILVPRNVSRRNHPNVLRPFLPEVQKIIEFTHREVLNEVQKSVQISAI